MPILVSIGAAPAGFPMPPRSSQPLLLPNSICSATATGEFESPRCSSSARSSRVGAPQHGCASSRITLEGRPHKGLTHLKPTSVSELMPEGSLTYVS
jgi:hypothetical protein